MEERKPLLPAGVGTAPSTFRKGSYLVTLLGATRPHFFAFPVGAAYAGVAATGRPLTFFTLAQLGLIAGGGWGVGQLLNDILDHQADALDAPHRPVVRGLLPTRPTVALAALLGLGLFALLATMTPHGIIIGGCAVVLIATYNLAKRFPLLGNISHGTLLACAALMGAGAAEQDTSLLELSTKYFQTLLLVFLWAALYLQGNYEKDARGDAAAGYRTLAHTLGVKASALTRALIAPALLYLLPEHLYALPFSLPAYVAAFGISVSALYVTRRGTQEAALRMYRFTVHGGTLAMLAFGGPALGSWAYLSLLVIAAVLTEWAFRRSDNP